jgi:hypothetical protein
MVSEWKATAKQQQQDFSNLFKDRIWDRFLTPSEDNELSKKIAFALLGPPRDENDDKTFGYSPEEWEKVIEIKEKCIDYCKMQDDYDNIVCVAFIFVCAFKSGSSSTIAPLIRVKNTTLTGIENSYFIDTRGRDYYTWKDYLDDNIFDGWWICVPIGAVYPCEEEVQVEFLDQSSREQKLQRAISKTEDLYSYFRATVPSDWAVNAIHTAVEAPGAVYGAGHNICELVDCGNHDQSIAMLHSEDNAISASKVAIFESFDKLSQKVVITPLDMLQLCASIFFVSHLDISFNSAKTLIAEAKAVREQLLQTKQNLGPDDQKVFDIMLKGHREMVIPGKVLELHGDKEFSRELKRINNLPEFFAHFSLGPSTQLNINQNLDIDAKAYFQMTPEQRGLILEKSRDLKNKAITHAQFKKSVDAIAKEFRIRFEHQRQEARQKIQEAFKVKEVRDIVVAGEKIFENLQPSGLDRLDKVFRKAGKEYDPDHIKVAKVMADILECKNVDDYTAVMEYTIRKLDEAAKKLSKIESNPKEKPVGVKTVPYYFKELANKLLSEQDQQNAMAEEFNKLVEECDPANSRGCPRFGNSYAAANHFDKHCRFPLVDPFNNLSSERYFEIAREMTNGLHVGKPILSQEGNLLRYTFTSLKYGAFAVRFDNLADGTSVIATLYKQDIPFTPPRLYLQ